MGKLSKYKMDKLKQYAKKINKLPGWERVAIVDEWENADETIWELEKKLVKRFEKINDKGLEQPQEQVATKEWTYEERKTVSGNRIEKQKEQPRTELKPRICATCESLDKAKVRAYCYYGSDSKEWKDALSKQWEHEQKCKILSDNKAFRRIEAGRSSMAESRESERCERERWFDNADSGIGGHGLY